MNIVIVDDDEVDIVAIRRALRKHGIANPTYVAHDGIEALRLLRGEEAPPGTSLLLLDINMPRMNGFEFLDELRADPELRDTAVIMLSTSDDERDRRAAYRKQVAGYLEKQQAGRDFTCLVELIRQIEPDGRSIDATGHA